MYEEKIRKINIDWKSLMIKMAILLVVLFVVLWIIALIRKDNKPKVESNLMANLKTMQTTANEYFTGSRLPDVINGRKKLTLQEMFDTKLLVEFKDQNNNSCDTKESYIEATKISSKEYTIKTKLICGEESEVAVNTVTIKQDDILVDNDKDKDFDDNSNIENPDNNTDLPNDDINNDNNNSNNVNSGNNNSNNGNGGNNNQSGGSSSGKPNNSTTTPVTTKVPVSEVRINYKKIYLNPGESKTVTAVVYPLNANDKNVIWSSSNNNVATVVRGKVTGIKAGNVLITASVGGKSTTMEVEVINKSSNISSGNNSSNGSSGSNNNGSNNGNSGNTSSSSNFNTMIVNEYRRLQDEAASLAKKTNTSLYVENAYSGGNKAVFNIVQRYGYANKTIYSYEMDSNGNRKVILDNRSSLNKATFTVNNNISPKYLNVSVSSVTIDSTENKAISYSSNDKVYFKSNDTSVVVVSSEGVIFPKGIGSTTIVVYTASGLSKNIKVHVTNPKTTGYLSVNQTELTLALSDTMTINYSSNEKVYFESDNANIATVSNSGVITPKGVGTTTIRVYTKSGLSKNVWVKVTNLKTDSTGTFLYLGTTNVVLAPNDNFILGYTSNGMVKFKSSNPSVASVSSDGVIVANRSGSTVITVTADGLLSRSVYVIVR